MNIELMKQRRKELGMTQQDLADKCELSRVTILNYENGRFEPTRKNLKKISKVLGVSELDLILNKFDPLEFIQDYDDYESTKFALEDDLIVLIVNELNKVLDISEEDIENITIRVVNIMKVILNFDSILYSSILEKVIFQRIADENLDFIEMCDLEIFLSTFKNIFSIINNQAFDKHNYDTDYQYPKILKAEYELLENLSKSLNKNEDSYEEKKLKDLSNEELTNLIEEKLDNKRNLTDEGINELEDLHNELLSRMSNTINKNIEKLKNKEGAPNE